LLFDSRESARHEIIGFFAGRLSTHLSEPDRDSGNGPFQRSSVPLHTTQSAAGPPIEEVPETYDFQALYKYVSDAEKLCFRTFDRSLLEDMTLEIPTPETFSGRWTYINRFRLNQDSPTYFLVVMPISSA
jgi:hypothetical protein